MRRSELFRMLVVTVAGIVLIVGLAHRSPTRSSTVERPAVRDVAARVETVRKKPAPKPRFTKKIAAFLRAFFAYIDAVLNNYRAWPDWPIWHALGRCEQGAQSGGPYDSNGDGIAWHGQPIGGLPGSGYPGGLGMSRAAWNAYRDEAHVSVSNGAYASPADQIRVGREEVRQIGGYHGWAYGTRQCMRTRFGVYV